MLCHFFRTSEGLVTKFGKDNEMRPQVRDWELMWRDTVPGALEGICSGQTESGWTLCCAA